MTLLWAPPSRGLQLKSSLAQSRNPSKSDDQDISVDCLFSPCGFLRAVTSSYPMWVGIVEIFVTRWMTTNFSKKIFVFWFHAFNT